MRTARLPPYGGYGAGDMIPGVWYGSTPHL